MQIIAINNLTHLKLLLIKITKISYSGMADYLILNLPTWHTNDNCDK